MNYKQRKWRDSLRAEYMNETGIDVFDPQDFLSWLKQKPEHPDHTLFFEGDENERKRATQLIRVVVSAS